VCQMFCIHGWWAGGTRGMWEGGQAAAAAEQDLESLEVSACLLDGGADDNRHQH
jgi:hypothetical protein